MGQYCSNKITHEIYYNYIDKLFIIIYYNGVVIIFVLLKGDNMKYKVEADNGQTLIMNLMYEEAISFAKYMKEVYPENNFFVIKQE